MSNEQQITNTQQIGTMHMCDCDAMQCSAMNRARVSHFAWFAIANEMNIIAIVVAIMIIIASMLG